MRYLCLVHTSAGRVDDMTSPEYEALADECRAYAAMLHGSGHLLTMEALESARAAPTVRLLNGEVVVMDTPSSGRSGQLRWIYLITARDLNEAIRLASGIPSARLGSVEVRPVRAADDHPFAGCGRPGRS